MKDGLSEWHVAHLEGPFPLSSELLLLLESSESDPDSLSDSSEDVCSASSSSSSLLLPPRSQNLDACKANGARMSDNISKRRRRSDCSMI